MILIYTLAWVPMVFIAIANGIARDKGYIHFGAFIAEVEIAAMPPTAG